MPRTRDTEFFLKRLRELDGSAGNKALRENLGWEEDKYFRVRKLLIEEGLVDIGRGKGGSVYLLKDISDDEDISTSEAEIPESEKDHYPRVIQKLEKKLKQDFKDAVVEQTAHLGKRITGGKWSRPDLMAITVQRFEYVLQDEFLLCSYEIKRSDRVDIDAVAEAAAHQRLAQMAYLVIVPHAGDNAIFDPSSPKRISIEKECMKYGVGLILIPDYRIGYEIEVSVDARSSNLNYKEMNSTIGRLFGEKKREEVKKLIKNSRPT